MFPAMPGPVRLLIVDDDAEVLRSLTWLAQTRGFAVEGCRSAGDAISRSGDGRRFGCLVIDQKLPDLPGIELLAQLRRRGIYAPAVLITTAPSPTLRRLAVQADIPIVEKPLLNDALFDQIERAIDPG